MTFILVLRETETSTSHVWQHKTLNGALGKARSYMARRNRLWSKQADRYLLATYRELPWQQRAKELRKILGYAVSKNAMIGRYHRLQHNLNR